MEFWKGDKKENQKRKQNRKKRRILKTGLSGEQNFKNLSNCRKLAFLGLFSKHKHKNTEEKKPNHQKKQKLSKKTAFCILVNNPLFFENFGFFQVTLFHVCKAVFCWQHYKNSVFSRAQLLGITDSKTPFRGPLSRPLPKMALLQPKVPFWVSPVPAETPIFIVFCHLEWPQKKKDHFPKTDSCNENVRFLFTFPTQIGPF